MLIDGRLGWDALLFQLELLERRVGEPLPIRWVDSAKLKRAALRSATLLIPGEIETPRALRSLPSVPLRNPFGDVIARAIGHGAGALGEIPRRSDFEHPQEGS